MSMRPRFFYFFLPVLTGWFFAVAAVSAGAVKPTVDDLEIGKVRDELRGGKVAEHHPTMSIGEVDGPEQLPATAIKLPVRKKVMDEVRSWDRRIWFFTSAAQPLQSLDDLAKAEIGTWGLELVGQVDRLRQLVGGDSVGVFEPGAFFAEKKTPPRLYITWSGHAPKLKGAVPLDLVEIPEPVVAEAPAPAAPVTPFVIPPVMPPDPGEAGPAPVPAPVVETPVKTALEIDPAILAAGMKKAAELGCNPIPGHASVDGKFVPCPEAKFKVNPQDRRFTVVNGDMIYNVGPRPLPIGGIILETAEAAIILNGKLVKLGDKLK